MRGSQGPSGTRSQRETTLLPVHANPDHTARHPRTASTDDFSAYLRHETCMACPEVTVGALQPQLKIYRSAVLLQSPVRNVDEQGYFLFLMD